MCPAPTARTYTPKYAGTAYDILLRESEACFVPDAHFRLLDDIVDDVKGRLTPLPPFGGDAKQRALFAARVSNVIGDVLESHGFALHIPTDALSDSTEAASELDYKHLFDCDTGSIIYLTVAQVLGLPVGFVEITLPSGSGHNYIRWQLTADTSLDWDTNGRGQCQTPPNTPAHQGRPLSPLELEGYSFALRAMMWERQRAFGKALSDLTVAVQKYPESSLAHNNLAWLISTKELPDRLTHATASVLHAERAVALLRNANHLDTLACSYALLGRFKEAMIAINEALRLNPGSGTFQLRRARIRASQDCTGFQ